MKKGKQISLTLSDAYRSFASRKDYLIPSDDSILLV